MTPEEKDRFDALCELIKREKNQQKFLELVTELNDLLEGKGHRLEHPQAPAEPN